MTRAAAHLRPDLTFATVARLLGYESARDFEARLTHYLGRGFPPPDPDTKRIDPDAFERWRRLRARHLYPELTAPTTALDAQKLWAERQGKWRAGGA